MFVNKLWRHAPLPVRLAFLDQLTIGDITGSVFLTALGADEVQIEASFCEAIRTAKEQKSISPVPTNSALLSL
jgi:hypothetical protein